MEKVRNQWVSAFLVLLGCVLAFSLPNVREAASRWWPAILLAVAIAFYVGWRTAARVSRRPLERPRADMEWMTPFSIALGLGLAVLLARSDFLTLMLLLAGPALLAHQVAIGAFGLRARQSDEE